MGRSRTIAADSIPPLIILAWTLVIAYPLLAARGLPSFNQGFFHTSTIAYYMSWAREADTYGLYTPAWCGGFDLLRFYPPLGLGLIYALGLLTGDFAHGAYIAFYVAIYAFLTALYSLTKTITGSRTKAVLMVLAVPLIAGYVSTISVYWEYTRVLGEAFALAALTGLVRLMENGYKKDALWFTVFSALTILSHLIATVELAVLATVTFIYKMVKHYRMGAGFSALIYPGGMVLKSLLYVLGMTGWWFVPALAPFGVEHYLRIATPLRDKIQVIGESLSLIPGLGAPAFQLPVIAFFIAGIILYFKRARDREKLPVYYALSLAVLVIVYGQGTRLIPLLGVTLLLVFLDSTSKAMFGTEKEEKALAALAAISMIAFAIAYAPIYLHDYWRGLRTDNSYVESDEFLVADFLEKNMEDGGRAYLMYGDRFHGNQWINFFSPRTWQVLSCFMEGCLNKEYLTYDFLLKNSLDYTRIYDISREHCIEYLVIDSKWYLENPRNSILLLEDNGLIQKQSITARLSYTLVFKVKGIGECKDTWKPPSKIDTLTLLFLPSRIIGYMVSAVSLLLGKKLTARLS